LQPEDSQEWLSYLTFSAPREAAPYKKSALAKQLL
jgi:hypothetical protein